VHALALGDWGVTLDGSSSVKKYSKNSPRNAQYFRDYYAQKNVAPVAVLSHGDNFYWSGLGPNDTESRFWTTFEEVYDHPVLRKIPWLNVMGNHDYGGSEFICDDECLTTQDMLRGLNAKFSRQQTYTSPYNDRWVLRDHYYKETLKDDASGITIDVYNVDTNVAEEHGGEQICCQCYSYEEKLNSCWKVARGHPQCAGGSTDMFDTCMAKLKEWHDDSLSQFARDAKASNATWKIVHSHYSPHHSMPSAKSDWFKAIKDGGVQLLINGHVHAEAHEFASINAHFITNGAGGGTQSEGMIPLSKKNDDIARMWSGANDTYGFFELSFAKDYLRAQYATFGEGWTFGNATKPGKSRVDYCYLIPHDGSKGTKC
ncbi:TPA: hypothetical protein N0F65_008107, partial [Lagenidium giganteum]